MRFGRLLGVAAVASASLFLGYVPSSHAAEALLIRHDVLQVPVGKSIDLRPGFFIGKAWTADGTVADASLAPDLRRIHFTATETGRTIVAAWNLREPNKRVEFEIEVVPPDPKVDTGKDREPGHSRDDRDGEERGPRVPGPY